MTITTNGSLLIIEDNGRTYSYPKRRIAVTHKTGEITIKNRSEDIFSIKNNATVTDPTSVSLIDLFNKINALIS